VELVRHVIQVALRLWLAREMLVPVPFFQKFVGKRVAVGPTFGVETGTGIPVPVPRAADVAAGLENPCREAEFPQLVELVEAGDAGSDDNGVVVRNLSRASRKDGFIQGGHVLRVLYAVPQIGGCPWPGLSLNP